MAEVSFGYGEVTYHQKVEDRPATSETIGNVTTKNIAVEGHPAYFEVFHRISSTSEQDGLTLRNSIGWTTLVPNVGLDTPYEKVEDEAAHRIPDALRALADELEKQIAETDERKANRSQMTT